MKDKLMRGMTAHNIIIYIWLYLKRNIVLFGLATSLSYLASILYTWINAELNGYTYFSAGEPNTLIRNIEWFGGIVAMWILIITIKKHLDENYLNKEVIYDPLV